MDPDNQQPQVPVQTPPIVQTPPPPVQTTPPIQIPPPVIPPETKKSSPLVTIAIASIVVAVIAVAAYLIGTKFLGQKVMPTPTATPVIIPSPTSTPDPTADWKTYTNLDLSFKYPQDWSLSNYEIASTSPKVRLVVVPSSSTLMNECMKEISTETKDDIVIKKFERVVTGVMCETSDSTPREIWVSSLGTKFLGGISYEYSSVESQQAEAIFNQILSTFRFLEQN